MQILIRFSITVFIFFLLLFNSIPVAAQISGNIKTVTGFVFGNVVGNNLTNGVTLLTDPGIPQNASDSRLVSDNQVTITGYVTGNTYGGITYGSGDVFKNTVIIASTSIVGTAYGGWSGGNVKVTENSVVIHGMAMSYVAGGVTYGSKAVTNNSVTINGTARSIVYGGWNAGVGSGSVTGNKVIINGKALASTYGGWAGNSAMVSDNTVVVQSGGEAKTIYGGRSGGSGDTARNNVIIESGGTAEVVYAGQSSGWGNVANNIVTIRGRVNKAVYGGNAIGGGNVTNNIINIYETAILTTASIWGSNLSGSMVNTGNTLNIYGFSGSIDTIGNFEHYNFMLGQLTPSLEFIIIGNPVNINDSYITIGFTPDFLNNNVYIGAEISVISKINANAAPISVTVVQSPFIAFDFTESYDTSELFLTVIEKKLQPQTKFVGEGLAASLAFLGQAADVRSSLYFAPQGPRFIPFATMVYGRQHIATGSSVSVNGFSSLAGLALNTNFDNGSQLVVGAFVEGGWGDYNSRNTFNNSATLKGKGDTEYYGGGVLARYALQSGLHGEGTLAVGKAETDFRTRDFTPGTRSQYDYSVPYYSAHMTVGQVLSLTNMLDLDIYGKYLWTRQDGDNVTVDGYRFKFKDADSHRLRAGLNLQADISSQLQPYVGMAYEYEFSGKIKGNLYGMHLDEPSLLGGTGIGELGLVWVPEKISNLKVGLDLQGYIGKREGVSGGLSLSMSF